MIGQMFENMLALAVTRERMMQADRDLTRQLLHCIKHCRHWLRAIRGDRTQAEIAKTADVPLPYISYVERGHTSSVSSDMLLRILAVYASLEHTLSPDTKRALEGIT